MDTERADTVVRNGALITMNTEREVLDTGYVAIRDGQIALVGHGNPPTTLRTDNVVDAAGGIVTPGLIDGHAHTAWGLARCIVPMHYNGMQSYLQREVPLSAAISDDDEALGTLLTCAEMALNGTTCFADTGSAIRRLDAIAESIRKVGIRGMISLFNTDNAADLTAVEKSTEECIERVETGLQHYPPGKDLMWACAGLLGGGQASDELVTESKALAARYGAQLNVHKSAGTAEVENSRRTLGKDPIVRLAELGVLDPSTTLIHVNVCSDEELEILLETGTTVVHCPSTSRLYGNGLTSTLNRFPELVQRGGPVGLGTDSTIFPNSWDLLRQAYLAAVLHRDGTGRPELLAGDVLEMATIGGASCVGRRADLGSIEVGKRADLVIHSTERPELHPLMQVVDSLIFSAGSRTVDTVIVDGETVVADGELTNVDLRELLDEVDRAAEDLVSRAGFEAGPRWPTGRSVGQHP